MDTFYRLFICKVVVFSHILKDGNSRNGATVMSLFQTKNKNFYIKNRKKISNLKNTNLFY